MDTEADKVCTFFRAKKRKGNIRKKKEKSDSSSEDDTFVVKAEKSKKENPNLHSTSKRSKNVEESSYKSTRSSETAELKDAGATRTYEIDAPDHAKQKSLQDFKEGDVLTGEDADVYTGLSNYKSYIEVREKPSGKSMHRGPVRAPSNIRVTAVIDYQPDVCKDYKETGYCGYGDNCKFLHDRGDYKSGWQLERDWDEEQEKKRLRRERGYDTDSDASGGEDDEADDGIPFACFICREPFTDPVVTPCGHYFCLHCAVAHNKESSNCFVCDQPTHGILNNAAKVIEKHQQKMREKEENRGKRTHQRERGL
eukprot:GCRY01002617.1.p1 GENE.GCRY01002617.1~~GCRY01002617.1.p1  ORF type:complete len:310 (-),score=64.25 GCRY01002617.1:23-952(-)